MNDTAEQLIAGVGETDQRIVELAEVVCFATVVDPALLRKARIAFFPQSHAGLEADLWFSSLVGMSGVEGFSFQHIVAERLQQRLASNPARYELAWKIVEEAHRSQPYLRRQEEELRFLAMHAGSSGRVVQFLEDVQAALSHPERRDLARWAGGLANRLPTEVTQLPEMASVALLAQMRLRGGDADARSTIPREPVGVRLLRSGVELAPFRESPGVHQLLVPQTDRVLIAVEGDGKELSRSYTLGEQMVVPIRGRVIRVEDWTGHGVVLRRRRLFPWAGTVDGPITRAPPPEPASQAKPGATDLRGPDPEMRPESFTTTSDARGSAIDRLVDRYDIQGVAIVVDSLEAIQAEADQRQPLRGHDGVACFDYLYTVITKNLLSSLEVGRLRAIEDPQFVDPLFVSCLDVAFANRYFAAMGADDPLPFQPRCWQTLLDHREDRSISPLMFAVAGVNAHLNYDLPFALVTACVILAREPESGSNHEDYQLFMQLFQIHMLQLRQHFESRFQRGFDRSLISKIENMVGDVVVTVARNLSWRTATRLWSARDDETQLLRVAMGRDRWVARVNWGLFQIDRLPASLFRALHRFPGPTRMIARRGLGRTGWAAVSPQGA